MFKLTTIVKPDQLGVVLQTLHESGIDPSQVSIDPAVGRPRPAPQRQPSLIKGTAVRKERRGNKPGRKRDGSIQRKAVAVLNSFGAGPIALTDIMSKAMAEGIVAPTIFRAIKLEIAAGNLRKLGRGQYQRTGAAFAESLGVAQSG
jgi:hypothetical protein